MCGRVNNERLPLAVFIVLATRIRNWCPTCCLAESVHPDW